MFGLNVLSQFVNDRQALLHWIARAKPSTMLFMDDISQARQVKALYPAMTVIYRQWNPHDHEYHHKMSPGEWVTSHAQFGQGGIVVQCLNEPQTYGDVTQLVKWCVEVIHLAAAMGITICLFNAAVGHPDSNNVTNGAFDPLWRAFHRYPQHIYGCHEYAVFSTQDERPFRIGRFLDVIHRCKLLDLSVPRIIVTETGRDVGGGASDGWRAVFNEQQYSDFLGGLRDIYSAYDVDCTVFCYGRGANGRWQSFDVEGAGTVLSRLVEYNQRPGSEPEMVRIFKEGATYSLNMRSEPVVSNPVNANVVGSIAPNESVQLVRVHQGWANVVKQNGTRGNVSLQNGVVIIQAV